MFGKKDSENLDKFDTIIGVNTTFEGNIQSEGTLRVDGKVKGDIKTTGNVFIGEKAVVTGNLSASNIHTSGVVEGNIEAKGTLRILATSKINGDIKVVSLITDEGGTFNGRCTMIVEAQKEKSK